MSKLIMTIKFGPATSHYAERNLSWRNT